MKMFFGVLFPGLEPALMPPRIQSCHASGDWTRTVSFLSVSADQHALHIPFGSCFFYLLPLCVHTDIFTLSHGGNQNSNHATVTVTLCQRSPPYREFSTYMGLFKNIRQHRARHQHEIPRLPCNSSYKKKQSTFAAFSTQPSSEVAVFESERYPITVHSKEMLNKVIGQERCIFQQDFFQFTGYSWKSWFVWPR